MQKPYIAPVSSFRGVEAGRRELNMKRFLIGVLAIAGFGMVLQYAAPSTVEAVQKKGRIIRSERAIPGRYIVVFEDWAAGGRGHGSAAESVAAELSAIYGGRSDRVFRFAINGYSAEMNEAQAAALSRDPRVKYVEEDGVMSIDTTQTNATWGIDRIDQRDLPLSGTYNFEADGSGVNVYIIDTGIRATHVDFGGRVSGGFSAINDNRGTDDCNGHGTHVAGTTGSATYGVAKNVHLTPVRVLNCQGSGTTSGVISGVDWVTANHISPSVANMSLGGGASTSLDSAVTNSINSGVVYAVAAGNSNTDACSQSPARAAAAITVGSTTSTDARSSFSNFGTCVDIFAPGSSITSLWKTSDTATNTISGTSMASPHVAGVAALVLQGNPGASPATVANDIRTNATSGKISSVGSGSPNLLLFMGFTGGGGGGGNQSPTASFTFSCTDLSCTFDASASSDPDGTIANYSWNFGDGATGSGVSPAHAYASSGTRTVTLTVTDNGGATAGTSQSVTVSSAPSDISLSVNASKVKGSRTAVLSWSGAAASVDIYRNGSNIFTVTGTTFTDNLGKGGGTVTYQVCNAGTSTCSNSVTVAF